MDSTQDASDSRRPDRWNSVIVPERVAQRALTNVDKRPDGCWISRYSVSTHGYAQIGWAVPKDQRRGKARNEMVLAHRAAWTAINGQVPLGMTIDHTCKERRCVNPDHLRLLPNFENARRINGLDWPVGECANGHPDSERVGRKARTKSGAPRDGSVCRECMDIYHRRERWKRMYPGRPFPNALLVASDSEAAS